MFSDQALEAFRIRLNDNDVEPLKAIFNQQELIGIETKLFESEITDRPNVNVLGDLTELRQMFMEAMGSL